MEYRDFHYTNEHGHLEIQRGSVVGIVISWVLLKSLHVAVLMVIAGLAFSSWKFFNADTAEARAASVPPTAMAAYAEHQTPIITMPIRAVPMPATRHFLTRAPARPVGRHT